MIAVHLEDGRVTVRQQPLPRRPQGFAMIRLLCAGLCNTDMELQRGYYGFRGTPGHEFVGEVVAADTRRLLGRRVVGEINLACGRCARCRRGLGRHCPGRKVLGIKGQPGVFAEYFVLPECNLHLVPDAIPTKCAVFTEPLAAACEILDQVRIPRGAPVAVLGDGKLGLLVAQVLQLHEAETHQFGRHKEKLAIVQSLGVSVTARCRHLPRAAFDWVVEATGSSAGLQQAVQMVRPRGTIVLKSTIRDLVPIDTAPLIVNEITLVGSRCGRFGPALRLLREGKVRVSEMISACVPLAEAPRAFELAAHGALKVLLLPAEFLE
jgi:threonine dehydrogenase-like Zn-dependent dehydrogenase